VFEMKKIFFILAVSIPFFAFAAAPLQLTFDKASVQTFLGTLYGKILQKSFVLSPEVLSLNRLVTLNVSLEPEMIGQFINGFLADQGLAVTDRDGVSYIGIKSVLPVYSLPSAGTPDLLRQPLPLPLPAKHELEAPVPSFKVFYPSNSTPASVCEAVNKVFFNSCHSTPVAVVLTHPLHLAVISELVVQLDVPVTSPDSLNGDSQNSKSKSENLPPLFKVFKPTMSTPIDLCESVNRVFLNTCQPAAAAVVLTHPQHLEVISELALQLDIKPTLVDVSATFIEVTGSKRDGYGFGLVANVLGGSLGLNLGATTDTSTITIKGANFTALLDILRSDGRFKQVASPSGRVSSGSLFNIAIGDEVPTLTGQSRDNTGLVTSQVVYRPSGVLLNVQPVAITQSDSPMVSTSVDAQVSSFSKTESGVNGSPTLSKRQIKTSLLLADGEVAVIGGLTGSRGLSARSSFFGLNLSNREDDQTTDLVLLLSAKVIKN
jgi:general secretion pathway protein D